MDSARLNPLEEIKNCIRKRKDFVLQGGAGSGKTETLKKTLEFISKKYPKDIMTIFKITIKKAVYISLTPDKIQ